MFLDSRVVHSPECVSRQRTGGTSPARGSARRAGCGHLPGYIPLLMVVLFIFVYGAIVRLYGLPDVLERKVIDSPSVHNFDGWAGTHFLFWGFMGYLFPGRHVSALAISLLWEGIEDGLGRNHVMVGGKRLQLVGSNEEDGETSGEGEYWYGRYVTDSFFNLAGYILGSAAANRYWPRASCAE
jgi:hypothetical protein